MKMSVERKLYRKDMHAVGNLHRVLCERYYRKLPYLKHVRTVLDEHGSSTL